MKVLIGVFAVSVVLAFSSTSRASITNAWWWDDYDGAIVCSNATWNPATDALSMTGDQYWGPAHMVGTVDTTGPEDPTLTLANDIENDTNFAWTSYIVNVYMSNTFTLANVTPLIPGDWTVASTTEPSSPLPSGPYTGEYEASFTLVDGTPVTPGNDIAFQYQLSFSGASHFAFTEEVIPVPEPAAFQFAALGGLLLAPLAFARRRRRAPKA
ncbi:MAG TPA: hypothetical protein VMV72_05670 [Verrucomicrobiae bacterium]|nr:hypothetical protein [Verrucomicrobiae bacterium]